MEEAKPVTSSIAPKKGPGIMGVILILGLVVLAGLVFYKFYSNPVINDNPVADEKPVTEVDTINPPTPTPNSVQIPQDWLTFSSDIHRFSIRYPPDMKVETPPNSFIRFIKIGSTQTEGTEVFDGIIVSIGSNPLNDRTLKEIVDLDVENTQQIGEITEPANTVTLNNVTGYRYRASALGDFTKYFLPIENTQNYLEISTMEPDPQNLGYAETVNMMLNTLQINTTSASSDWLKVGNNGLLVNSQMPGISIRVDRVALEEPGYIVVHATNQDGRPGAVIGRSNIITNGGENITIQLTTPTSPGDSIFVMLHDDDGDREYEYPDSDLPITGEGGSIIMQRVEILRP